MTCEKAYELMQALIDDQCTAEDQALLRAHLETCEDCRRIFEAYQEIQARMLDLEEEPPEGLARGVMYRIRKGDKKPRKFSFGAGTILAAAVLLLLLVGSGVLKNLRYDSAKNAQDASAPAEMESYSVNAVQDDYGRKEETATWNAPMAKPADAAPEEAADEPMDAEDGISTSLQAVPSTSMPDPGAAGALSNEPESMPEAEQVNILRVHLNGQKASKVAPDEFLYPMEGGYWFESTLQQAQNFVETLPDACSAEFDLIDDADEDSLILVWLLDD